MSLLGQYFIDGVECTEQAYIALTRSTIESTTQAGIFETIKLTRDTLPLLLPKHLARLERGLDAILSVESESGSNSESEDWAHAKKSVLLEQCLRQVQVLSKYMQSEHAVLRYQVMVDQVRQTVTNSLQVRAFQPLETHASLMLSTVSFPPSGMHAGSNGDRRDDDRRKSDGRKGIARQLYTAALDDIKMSDATDALLKDSDGCLIEGAKTNLFLLNDDALITPSLALHGVAGVMREWVIERAQQLGLAVTVTRINEATLLNSDVIFITNAVQGVKAVHSVLANDKKRTKYELKTQSMAYKNLLKLSSDLIL